MQLLDGETLTQRIRREGRLSREQAFPIIVQMAEGLQAAHDVGIIHRDFKSGNVILTNHRAVITDFGLAGLDERLKAAEAPDGTAESRVTGTVAFMSPEQSIAGERSLAQVRVDGPLGQRNGLPRCLPERRQRSASLATRPNEPRKRFGRYR